jgi:hypothetical protein
MLTAIENESRANHPDRERLEPLRRRPRTDGWPDVRELQGSTTCAPKYHVDLNMTAHLDWSEWQRLCAAVPSESDESLAWCMLPPIYVADEDEDGKTNIEQEESRRANEPHREARRDSMPQRLVRRSQPDA